MLAAANRLSIAGAEQALDFLMEDYLIFEATPGTESAIDFARRHRMIPQMLGLGNTSEGLALFSVGTDRPALGVDVGAAYELHEWAHMDANVWRACEGAATTAVQAGIEDHLSTDPAANAGRLAQHDACPAQPHAIYLDTRLAS